MTVTKTVDVVTIGAGVVGCSIARELSQYNLKSLVIEKDFDCAMGTTKANSGIVHAGFHAPLTTLKGQLVHHGNRMIDHFWETKELDFGYRRIGELVVATCEEELPRLKEIHELAIAKGIPCELWDQKKLQKEEPNLSKDLLCALYGPTGSVINPYEFTFSLKELAEQNGVEFSLNNSVIGIDSDNNGGFIVHTTSGDVSARYVINAAGLYADKIANMIGDFSYSIKPRKGEEYLLDKSYDDLFNHVIFPVGNKVSKGTLIIPTVDKTVMIGPSADDTEDRDNLTTSTSGQKKIFKFATDKLSPLITTRGVIASFAGLRAASNTGDFIIGPSEKNNRFINVGGIQSPGLTAAPAIATYVLDILKEQSKGELSLDKIKSTWSPVQKDPLKLFFRMNDKEQEETVDKDPNYADVVCRCEMVTIGDVHSSIDHGARTLDGVKFRTRAGMGRCQAGFCSSRIMQILADRYDVPLEDISKKGTDSKILVDNWSDPRYDPVQQRLSLKKKWKKKQKNNLPDGNGLKQQLESKIYDVAIIGGGAAGMAAAKGAKESGVKNICMFDREPVPGGILLQCIHSGFGLKYFKEELTGPEYADRVEKETQANGTEMYQSSYVYRLKNNEKTGLKELRVLCGSELGGAVANVQAKTVIFAMGSRERSRAAINIPGSRPAGVYTAGLAQKMINEMGSFPGKKAVILGSGDIGLIMARRLALEGCKVEGVFEILPTCSGLKRNVVQCLDDYGIPLHLSHTVVNIVGKDRLEKVTIAPVNPETWEPIMEKAYDIECDTLLLSVGLIPENELSASIGVDLMKQTNGAVVGSDMMTNIEGCFSAGNVLHIHDIVDNVTLEGIKAGKAAAMYLKNKVYSNDVTVQSGDNVGYVVPSELSTELGEKEKEMEVNLSLRCRDVMDGATFKIVDKETGEVLIKKKMGHKLLPAEMIIYTLKNKQLKLLKEAAAKKNGKLNISVVLEPIEKKEKKTKKSKKKSKNNLDDCEVTQYVCVSCPEGCDLDVFHKGKEVIAVKGNKCKKGIEYAHQEHVDPRRVFSTTIGAKTTSDFKNTRVVPVKLTKPLPRDRLLEASAEIHKVLVDHHVKVGDVVARNILGEEGCNLVVCRREEIVSLN